jgi:PAS domain S-box-containing protein
MNTAIAIMEEMVPLADLVAFLAAVGALLVMWRGWAGSLGRHLRLTAAGIAGLLFFHNTSDVLEWMRITAALDPYEDYSEMLFPLLYFLATFIFVQERSVGELRESEHQLRTANQQLRASEQQLEAGNAQLSRAAHEWQMTFDAANDAIWIVDKNNNIIRSNSTSRRMFGESTGEIGGRHCWEIVHRTAEPICGCPLVKAQKSLTREKTELQIGTGWLQVTVDPILDTDSSFAGAVHFVSNITERKLAEQEIAAKGCQLEAANQQLRASEQQLRASNQQLTFREAQQEKLLKVLAAKNKELESIVYVASHDLRSPLVNIEGFGAELGKNCAQLTTILADSGMTGEKLQQVQSLIDTDIPECLNFISVSAEKMNALLDGLLQVCRVGTATIDIQRVDMKSVFSEIVETSRFKAKACGATITVENVPDCLGDETMVNQLFSNLMDNALKYLDPNRAGKIRICGQTDGDASVYCVEDNGIGIAPAHVGKVFEVFHRLNPADKAGGEGLGLTIVMRVLDRLNGSIRIDSEPGKGSRFRVTLPAVR